MKQLISVKVIESRTKQIVFKDVNLMEITDKTTVSEIIPQIKALVIKPLNQIESEKFFCGNSELKLEDVVPNTSGNELEIIVK